MITAEGTATMGSAVAVVTGADLPDRPGNGATKAAPSSTPRSGAAQSTVATPAADAGRTAV
jgi:hypothetical protein